MIKKIAILGLIGVSIGLVEVAGAANNTGLLCKLYVGGPSVDLALIDNTLTATSKGVTVSIYSMGDNSFARFQAVLNVPNLSDIRAYGTKDGLAALDGNVVGYLNHSREDEISVNCDVRR
jgi:hypothetical protein